MLHTLVATAKQSDSPVVRYGAVVVNDFGEICGTGYSRMADANDPIERKWADQHEPPRMHAEMAALCDAEKKGHNVSTLHAYILPLAPDRDSPKVERSKAKDEPAGYLVLRDTDAQGNPHFTCTDCGPKFAALGVDVHILTNAGWKNISAEQAEKDAHQLAKLQEETGGKPRRNLPFAQQSDQQSLEADGYRYLATPFADIDEITLPISNARKHIYNKMNLLEKQFQNAWSATTSSNQERSTDNPAAGQSSVSAAYVQAVMGGDIVRVTATAPDGSTDAHYFNILPDGTRLDFTARQFAQGTGFEPSLNASNEQLVANTDAYLRSKGINDLERDQYHSPCRDYILSDPQTAAREAALVKEIHAFQQDRGAGWARR